MSVNTLIKRMGCINLALPFRVLPNPGLPINVSDRYVLGYSYPLFYTVPYDVPGGSIFDLRFFGNLELLRHHGDLIPSFFQGCLSLQKQRSDPVSFLFSGRLSLQRQHGDSIDSPFQGRLSIQDPPGDSTVSPFQGRLSLQEHQSDLVLDD